MYTAHCKSLVQKPYHLELSYDFPFFYYYCLHYVEKKKENYKIKNENGKLKSPFHIYNVFA
jgi:hypothetical protein